MGLQDKVVVLTGASMGIGEAIASRLAEGGAYLMLLARNELKLSALVTKLKTSYPASRASYRAVDVSDYEQVDKAIASAVDEYGQVDILINNAGIALGAPDVFQDLKISDITTMNKTNVSGMMFVTHSVLNRSMAPRGSGTILNVTSVTGLEVPPFPGEAVYHANKACQEAFTNGLRNELGGTNIRVLALRPGSAATHFHSLRVGEDKATYDAFFEGFEPLIAEDVAEAAIYMLNRPSNVSIKALDVVPSAQRSVNVLDRTWNERNS